jgi:hypothetical protein
VLCLMFDVLMPLSRQRTNWRRRLVFNILHFLVPTHPVQCRIQHRGGLWPVCHPALFSLRSETISKIETGPFLRLHRTAVTVWCLERG